MVSYLYRMPTGIVGDITRTNGLAVEAVTLTTAGTAGSPTSYGVPLVIDATSGKARTLATGDVRVHGLLARAYPTNAAQDGLGVATLTVLNGQAGDSMRRGYMTVLLSGSTAAVKGQPVFVWTAAASGTHIIGGYESTDPGANGFVLPSSTFQGAADTLGIVEIAFNI